MVTLHKTGYYMGLAMSKVRGVGGRLGDCQNRAVWKRAKVKNRNCCLTNIRTAIFHLCVDWKSVKQAFSLATIAHKAVREGERERERGRGSKLKHKHCQRQLRERERERERDRVVEVALKLESGQLYTLTPGAGVSAQHLYGLHSTIWQ